MKRILLSIAVLLSITMAYATTPSKIIKELQKVPGVVYTDLKDVINKFGPTAAGTNIPNGIENIQVIHIEKSTPEQISELKKYIKEFQKSDKFSTKIQKGGDYVFMKGDDKTITEIFVVNLENDESNVVLINGKIDTADKDKILKLESKHD